MTTLVTASSARIPRNGIVIVESDETVVVEGNHYFPEGAVEQANLRPSDTKSVCPWKGTASYYDVVVDGEVNADAAWYCPEPKKAAMRGCRGRFSNPHGA